MLLSELPLKACEIAIVEESKWVLRFVDYTSKYGLGFLLNDGRYVNWTCRHYSFMSYIHTLIICISSCSSGVYFNDSTKAVLSANSDSFVYIERRKSNTEGPTEPVASYTLSDYPEDTLKKKVTLLQGRLWSMKRFWTSGHFTTSKTIRILGEKKRAHKL